MGGVLHDATGSYGISFLSGAAVLLVSTVLTWLIREQRVAAPQPAMQPS